MYICKKPVTNKKQSYLYTYFCLSVYMFFTTMETEGEGWDPVKLA